jgi:hypothetical protein
LPRGNPRRRYCGNACAARAYRARVRAARKRGLDALILEAVLTADWLRREGVLSADYLPTELHCPICRQVLYQGVRRRADAVYCSQACRSAAYRRRRGDHDAKP